MADRITGLGDVSRVQKPGCGHLDMWWGFYWKQRGGGDVPKPLSLLPVLYSISCQCFLLVKLTQEPEDNGMWEM